MDNNQKKISIKKQYHQSIDSFDERTNEQQKIKTPDVDFDDDRFI